MAGVDGVRRALAGLIGMGAQLHGRVVRVITAGDVALLYTDWESTAGEAHKAIERLRAHASDGERIEVVGRVAYLHTPNGFGTSKLGEKFDQWIGVDNTARNWNTVLKLLELVRKAAG